MDNIGKILVRSPNWIGDAVMALPAVAALKELYPKAEITVLAKPWTVPVFENNPAVTEIIEYDSRGAHKGFISGKLSLACELKKRGFDMAVLFQNAFEAAFISRLAGIPRRVGYARDLRSLLLTKAIRVTDEIKRQHHIFYYLNIIAELGEGEVKIPDSLELAVPVINLNNAELKRADEILASAGIDEKRLVIGAAPGASFGPAKRWPIERFAEVLNKLNRELGTVPIILGGPDDVESAERLKALVDGECLNLAGKTSLREFMAVTKRLGLFITNDSGPMHIAAALGTPTVALFGSTDPIATGPVGERVKVVRVDMDCSPCFKRVCPLEHLDCLNNITADMVFDVSLKLLGEVRS